MIIISYIELNLSVRTCLNHKWNEKKKTKKSTQNKKKVSKFLHPGQANP